MNLALDVEWASGLLLAMTRVAAFVVATPLMPRAVPVVGRAGVVIVLGYFLADPLSGPVGLDLLLAASVSNAVVGLTLGYLTGIVFHLFPIAGGIVDVTSGISVGAVFDPSLGDTGAVFSRLFTITALTAFFVIGGVETLVRGLATSIDVVPLDGAIGFEAGLATVAVTLVGRMMIAGIELALPVLTAIVLAEVVLGLASRFAPQANVFLLGLPLKLIATFATVAVVMLAFPETLGAMLDGIDRTFVHGLRGLSLR